MVHWYNLNLICINTQTFITEYGCPHGQLLPPHEKTILQLLQPPHFWFCMSHALYTSSNSWHLSVVKHWSLLEACPTKSNREGCDLGYYLARCWPSQKKKKKKKKKKKERRYLLTKKGLCYFWSMTWCDRSFRHLSALTLAVRRWRRLQTQLVMLRCLLTALDTVERDTAFLCKSCHRCGWVGFNPVFEVNKKPGSVLRITLNLVFFSINIGLLFKIV